MFTGGGGKLGSETARYILHRIGAIFPYYLFAFIFSFIIVHSLTDVALRSVVKNMIDAFFPFIRVNLSGLVGFDPMGTAWYLSAMFLAAAVLYPLLRSKRNMFTYVIAPLITLFLYGYISITRGNVSAASIWIGLVYVGVLRAFAGLSLGCICYELAGKFKQLKLTVLARGILTVAECIGYILPLMVMQLRGFSNIDFIIIFIFAGTVTISFSAQSYSADIITTAPSWVPQMSLAVFLCQGPFISFTKRLLPDYDLYQRLPFYLAFCIITGLLCMWCGNALKRWWTAHKDAICKALIIEHKS